MTQLCIELTPQTPDVAILQVPSCCWVGVAAADPPNAPAAAVSKSVVFGRLRPGKKPYILFVFILGLSAGRGRARRPHPPQKSGFGPGNNPQIFSVFIFWVLEGSLAGFFGCRGTALELVFGADFSRQLMCGAGPGDQGGSRGSGPAKKPRRTRPKQILPDCSKVPRLSAEAQAS